MPHKVLQRTYSTRFNDFALDGVLYHESDLEEHYTDSHGYTEINFAAFVMVGMRFCPRIRSLHRQRIYCADPARDHGAVRSRGRVPTAAAPVGFGRFRGEGLTVP